MPKTKSSKKQNKFVPYCRGFHLPTSKDRKDALGAGSLGKEYDCGNTEEFFPPVPKCTSIDDWLAQYEEDGQTFPQFLEECPWLSTRKRKSVKQTFSGSGLKLKDKYPDGKIYLLPIGEFNSEVNPSIEALQNYTTIFIGVTTEILPPVKLEFQGEEIFWQPKKTETDSNHRKSSRKTTKKLISRFNSNSGKFQISTITILEKLRSQIPDDALCLIGLTMSDLYCDDTDLFVAGLAAGNHRVAVFSFARYDPNLTFSKEFWYDIGETDLMEDDERKRLVLLRSCKLLVHEICHLLGIDHCIFYSCCMNGSGHLEEDFRQPMFMCPVDLRKLQHLVGFDIKQRYTQMKDFFKQHNMMEETTWLDKRLQYITDV